MALPTSSAHHHDNDDFGEGRLPRILSGQERSDGHAASKDHNIAISATSKQAGQMVAPFLAEHIPEQYNPFNSRPPDAQRSPAAAPQGTNTKYCYRHRPDLKCRRQINEPSMEQLQHELAALSQSDQQGIAHVWSLFSASPSKHRNLMLQGILAQCCFPQLSFISAAVRDLIKIDFMSALPPELGFKILCYLDTTSLCKAAQVSQRWRALADDDVVWHKMCEQHIDRKCTKCGWGLPLLERKRLRTEKRQIQLRATGRGLNQWSPNITPYATPPVDAAPAQSRETSADVSESEVSTGNKRPFSALATPESMAKKICAKSIKEETDESYFKPRVRPWKDVYKDRFKVGTNWKYGRCSTKIFKGHSNGVMCLQFDDNILATGSYDATIKIWDIESGQEIRTLSGHTSGIRCLQFDDSKLISGSIDNTIKVWNWRTGECMRTLTGHTAGVISLHFDGKFLVSGSMDKTIRVWDFQDKSSFLLRGHTDWVNAVKVDAASRTLLSASDDCTSCLWDLDTRQCLKVYEGHVGQVQQVLPMPAEFEPDDALLHADAPPHHHQQDVQPKSDLFFSPSYSEQDPHGLDVCPSATYVLNPTPRPPFPDLDVCPSATCVVSKQPSSSTTTTSNNPHSSSSPPSLSSSVSSSSSPSSTRPAPPRYMLTGALDNTIKLWDVWTGRDVKTLFGHVEGVWALAADTLRVVSGSEDRMVKVWDPRTGGCERTFAGHAGPVTCVGLSDRRMATGSEDCEVRLHSF
ncbi:MAG: hypothetical protein M1821_002978 [Bathelium mastoideum]|nr:MAG: hypothetical protein M1821_002978 [Bathelium mastoideum]KAI9681871.1 MAG: hypothetical protein M1822_006948 [Bathelium mastoideum]